MSPPRWMESAHRGSIVLWTSALLASGCARYVQTPASDAGPVDAALDARADSSREGATLDGRDLASDRAALDLARDRAPASDLATAKDLPPKDLPPKDLPPKDLSPKDLAPKKDLALEAGSPVKQVFVTSTLYGCNLGGLAGADAKCQAHAVAAGLEGNFRAWLSSSATTAAARLTHSNSPYQLVNGTVIATSWADLTDGALLAPIDRTETGGIPAISSYAPCSYNVVVWSTTSPSGGHAIPGSAGNPLYFGNDWQSTGSMQDGASFGRPGQVGSGWTHNCQMGGQCSLAQAALYCFEQ